MNKKELINQIIEIIELENNYTNFRTGYSFREIRRELSFEQQLQKRNGCYMFVSRHTVLGRWHELKKQLFRSAMEELRKDLQTSSYKELKELLKKLKEYHQLNP